MAARHRLGRPVLGQEERLAPRVRNSPHFVGG